jgi:hypothetical protein
MKFFTWVQGVLIGKTGNVAEVTSDSRLDVVNRGLMYSHSNTQTANITLIANKNYYVDTRYIIDSGVTVTIPTTSTLKIT